MFFHMVYKSGQIFLPFCHNPRVWQTDGQTDRRTDERTDRQTEFSSLDRVCIPCSAVINVSLSIYLSIYLVLPCAAQFSVTSNRPRAMCQSVQWFSEWLRW